MATRPRPGQSGNEEGTAFSVKCWIKVAACATLIGLPGANVGLQIVLWFDAPTRQRIVAPQQVVQHEGGPKTPSSEKTNDIDIIPLIAAGLGGVTGFLTLLVIGYQTIIFRGQHKI